MTKQFSMHLKINGTLYRLRRLPLDQGYPGVVAFSLESREGAEVCAFSEPSGEASCSCGKRSFGECLHVRAIREAALDLGGLPKPMPDWLKELGFTATNEAYWDRVDAAAAGEPKHSR